MVTNEIRRNEMKKISKILSVFLAMTMLLGCCIFTVSAEADSAVWDGTVDTSPSTRLGSAIPDADAADRFALSPTYC